MKRLFFIFGLLVLAACSRPGTVPYGKQVTIPDDVLRDKIRGGWYGQTIGCTYGGPTEFHYLGETIPDDKAIPWYEDYILETFTSIPGLYDDVYMDITFLETMVKNGLDCPAKPYADAFANAGFMLWHANQMARYNILNGIDPPASGFWKNNPHADDIDFQIESDFIGMLYPGRPSEAFVLADRIGHIMNYGDGWYGGVFMSAMYSLAYVCDDIPALVRESLKAIPEGTGFHSCISDVLKYHGQYPDDWKKCWEAVMQLHNEDKGCPEGALRPLNIDARINAAYVVIGLLYGGGDFGKTIDISTRCGQDSDCNPSTAAGILGVIHGYSAIPDEWKKGAEKIKDMTFPYTSMSLEDVCKRNFDLVKASLGREDCTFRVKRFRPVRFEQSFEGLRLSGRQELDLDFDSRAEIPFEGCGVCVTGQVKIPSEFDDGYVADVTVLVDGEEVERVCLPVSFLRRKDELFAGYDLSSGSHTLTLIWNNPVPGYSIKAGSIVTYDKE